MKDQDEHTIHTGMQLARAKFECVLAKWLRKQERGVRAVVRPDVICYDGFGVVTYEKHVDAIDDFDSMVRYEWKLSKN